MSHRRSVAIVSPEQARVAAEQILERALRSADEAEVFYAASSSTPVRFEANVIKGVDANDAMGAALRIIKDGRVGFSSTSNLDEPQALVDAAIETAPFGAEAHFEFPGAQSYPDVRPYDASVEEATLEEMVALGERAIDDLRAYSTEAQIEGGVGKSTSTLALVNSRGGSVAYERSRFQLGFEGTVIRGEDMLFTMDSESSIAALHDPSGVVSSVIRQLEWAKETAAAETKTMPVILMPTAVRSVLLSPLLAGLNGKSVLQGTSPLVGRLGERIVDERFSLTDDPTLTGVAGARPADDECVASRRMPLIESGVASAFFYDLQTAGQAGVASTGAGGRGGGSRPGAATGGLRAVGGGAPPGAGERGLGSLPGPSTSVLLVDEGDAALDDIIAGMEEALIVERLLGAGQSNVLGGDFNANILLGYKVEHGRVVGRVKNTMISGNAYRALNDVLALGSEGRWMGSLYAPAIAVGGISVSSTG